MSKTLLHRLFGFGGVPKAMKPILEQEGIVLLAKVSAARSPSGTSARPENATATARTGLPVRSS